jgi:hypothetical protein
VFAATVGLAALAACANHSSNAVTVYFVEHHADDLGITCRFTHTESVVVSRPTLLNETSLSVKAGSVGTPFVDADGALGSGTGVRVCLSVRRVMFPHGGQIGLQIDDAPPEAVSENVTGIVVDKEIDYGWMLLDSPIDGVRAREVTPTTEDTNG